VAHHSRKLIRTSPLALVLALTGCIVQGGEEQGRETDLLSVGVIRYEAINQTGKLVGSGCTIDASKFYDQIHFGAAPGDRVELSERFEAVATTVAMVDKHRDDAEYWCSQTDTRRYHQVLDVSCWKSVEPDASEACWFESALVGSIEAHKFIPELAVPTAGKTDGFTLSIAVLASGKQCIQMRCTEGGIGREQLAFVVE